MIGEDTILAVHNVHKTYLLGVEGIPALRGVSASVRRGEFVVIFGTSGGGKTSMLNILGTIDKPTKGDLYVCGTRVTASTSDREMANIRLNRIGFVFQTFNLLGSLTALENVMLPMILKGVLNRKQRIERAREVLGLVGMAARTSHFPSMLSGGEQQRVTIARAIANNPDLLLLDEPTGDLDHANSNIVMRLLLDLNAERNITLVMVTHDVNLKALADRVIWMRDGKIARVELADPARRAAAVAALDAEVAAIRAAAAARSASAGAPKASSPSGQPVRVPVSYANTEIRVPSSYAPICHVRSRKGKRIVTKRLDEANLVDVKLASLFNSQIAPLEAVVSARSASAGASTTSAGANSNAGANASAGANSSATSPRPASAPRPAASTSVYGTPRGDAGEPASAGPGAGAVAAAAPREFVEYDYEYSTGEQQEDVSASGEGEGEGEDFASQARLASAALEWNELMLQSARAPRTRTLPKF